MRYATKHGRWILPLAGAVAAASSLASADDADHAGTKITIEQLEARSIVALEHKGPYWTVRRKLNDVVAYMKKRGHAGPLIIRYGADPTGPQAASLSSLVGFITDGDFEPEAPFRRVELPAEQVATETLAPGSGFSPRKFEALTKWANEHGYEPAGPMAELYYNTVDTAEAQAARRKVVLQVVVKQRPGGPSSKVGPTHAEQPPATQPASKAPALAKPTTSHVSQGAKQTAQPASPPEPAKQVAVVQKPVAPEAGGTAPATKQPVDTKPKADSSPVSPSPAAQPPPKPAAPADDGSKTIKELLESGRIDAVVDRVLPADRAIPETNQIWLGQVVFRVKAAAKGMDRVYPGKGKTLRDFSEALQRRFDAVSKLRSKNSTEQAVVRVDPEHRAHASKRQRELLMRLDRFLARIAFQTIPASSVVSDLGTLVGEVDQEIDSWYGPTAAKPDKKSGN